MLKKLMLIALLSTINISYADCNLIEPLVKNFINKNHLTGAAIALVRDQKIEYCNYGYSDLAKRHKVTENTIFEIASITKTFTATMAAIAQLEGKYDLAKPITAYLSELKNPYYQKINGIELLTHTANIPHNVPAHTDIELFHSLNAIKYSPTSQPQLFYLYSNPGIALVGMALQYVYEKSYQDTVEMLMLHKLKMKDTFVNIPPNFKGVVSEQFDENNKRIPSYNSGSLVATGGLKSNTKDLALYLSYQINGSHDALLNKALTLVHKNYYCVDNHRYQQLAWEYRPIQDLDITSFNDRETILKKKITTGCTFKNGFIEKTGRTSYIVYSPKNKVGMVILLNKGLVGDRVVLGRKIIKMLEKLKSSNKPF